MNKPPPEEHVQQLTRIVHPTKELPPPLRAIRRSVQLLSVSFFLDIFAPFLSIQNFAISAHVFVGIHVPWHNRQAKINKVQSQFTNLHIKNLPTKTTTKELNDVFGKFGPITLAAVQEDKHVYVALAQQKDATNQSVQRSQSLPPTRTLDSKVHLCRRVPTAELRVKAIDRIPLARSTSFNQQEPAKTKKTNNSLSASVSSNSSTSSCSTPLRPTPSVYQQLHQQQPNLIQLATSRLNHSPDPQVFAKNTLFLPPNPNYSNHYIKLSKQSCRKSLPGGPDCLSLCPDSSCAATQPKRCKYSVHQNENAFPAAHRTLSASPKLSHPHGDSNLSYSLTSPPTHPLHSSADHRHTEAFLPLTSQKRVTSQMSQRSQMRSQQIAAAGIPGALHSAPPNPMYFGGAAAYPPNGGRGMMYPPNGMPAGIPPRPAGLPTRRASTSVPARPAR
ncbi:hypothetical protein PCASD_03345 [Puccinia coronata f. sp. avenae]|uniref:RRM domain-containing protein n=1 Tax=Puccinia coronata f. sp. avenae TaxID=200324 RepID=A0A2N5VE05_9BASI|nr:hypothetical protein PCASD_03345 [Puccinia coronata f. sp. avenae]